MGYVTTGMLCHMALTALDLPSSPSTIDLMLPRAPLKLTDPSRNQGFRRPPSHLPRNDFPTAQIYKPLNVHVLMG